MIRRTKPPSLTEQITRRSQKPIEKKPEYEGNTELMISTGSTLLDLAISGGRIRGGGIPLGILVEISGVSGSGKTVLLCEIAGDIQRKQGEVMFHDPEARLNTLFAQIFDLQLKAEDYYRPNTVPEVFKAVREWKPKGELQGIFADSLAALSTDMEMDKKEGDKMGMRRAKEFSEELRKTCRILAQNNYLMVCSNQVRVNVDGNAFTPKYTTPGGEAIGFYSSLRLQAKSSSKLWQEESVAGKDIKRAIGITTEFEVNKSSIWKPFRSAPVTIIFDYGIDDIRENLKFLKTYTKATTYKVGEHNLGQSMEMAILKVEKMNLEEQLKEEVIDLWMDIESRFDSERKTKKR